MGEELKPESEQKVSPSCFASQSGWKPHGIVWMSKRPSKDSAQAGIRAFSLPFDQWCCREVMDHTFVATMDWQAFLTCCFLP